jgi:transcriptional regulator with XRE-family HTH domain
LAVPRPSKSEIVRKAVVEALQRERLRQNLSMNRVAQHAGLSQQMVSYVERGIRLPSLDTVLRIAEALQIDLGKVITEASDPRKHRSR